MVLLHSIELKVNAPMERYTEVFLSKKKNQAEVLIVRRLLALLSRDIKFRFAQSIVDSCLFSLITRLKHCVWKTFT